MDPLTAALGAVSAQHQHPDELLPVTHPAAVASAADGSDPSSNLHPSAPEEHFCSSGQPAADAISRGSSFDGAEPLSPISTPRSSGPAVEELSLSDHVTPVTPVTPVTLAHVNHGAIAIPSPPDPELAPEQLNQLLARASPVITETRFSMQEFLKNKAALASAARRELGGVDPSHHTADEDDVGICLEGSSHDAELSRQSSHLAGVVEGVTQESKVNRELAALLVERLDSSRKALECLLRLLTTLTEAESAYSLAMAAAAKAASAGPLTSPTDSPALAAAAEGLVQLPAAAAAGHRQLYLEMQLLVERVRGLWRRYSSAAKELKQSVQGVQRSVDSCCKQLNASLSEHKAVCEAFDASIVWQLSAAADAGRLQRRHQRGSSTASALSSADASISRAVDAGSGAGSGAVDAVAAAGGCSSTGGGSNGGGNVLIRPRFVAAPAKDPWTTEGKLVLDQQALQRWQDQERDLLQRGFEALQTLELERVAQMSQAGQALASSYSSALSGLPAAAEELKGMVAMLGGGGEAGLAHLAQVAAEMRMTSEQLATRQAEAVATVSQDLFCSPEIIRQGPMEIWDSKASTWSARHFVLTRAGFLHWFSSMEDTLPCAAPLNLSRCEFEAGQAPVFHLVEAGAGSWLVGRHQRKVTLKAGSVEECCEWAIALREAIALSSSTGAAAIPSGSRNSSAAKHSSR